MRTNLKILYILLLCIASLQVAMHYSTSAQSVVQLDHQYPNSYLDRAESMLAQSRSNSQLKLVKEILAVGLGLAAEQGNTELASSMCILLADIESNTDLSRYLWDCAVLLDPDRLNAWALKRNQSGSGQSELQYTVIRVLYLARNGEARELSALLAQAQVKESIRTFALNFGHDPDQILKVLESLRSYSLNDPCMGSDFIFARENGKMVYTPCMRSHRPTGLCRNDQEFMILSEFEYSLIQASMGLSSSKRISNNSWSKDLNILNNKVVQLPSIDGVLSRYEVDIDKPILVGEQWKTP